MRGKACEGGDLATAECAELGEFTEQGSEDGGSDTGNGGQQLGLFGQDLILGDEACDL